LQWQVTLYLGHDDPRLCWHWFHGVVPPDPKQKPPTAKVVADCKFLKEEDERLG
jgi:hypothetical protein